MRKINLSFFPPTPTPLPSQGLGWLCGGGGAPFPAGMSHGDATTGLGALPKDAGAAVAALEEGGSTPNVSPPHPGGEPGAGGSGEISC